MNDTAGVDLVGPIPVASTAYTPGSSFSDIYDYEWNVQAFSSSGQTGTWGDASHFTAPPSFYAFSTATLPSIVADASLAVSVSNKQNEN